MSKLTENLKAHGVFNPYELYAKGEVYLTYSPRERVFSARWSVQRKGYKTDPKAHWADYGCKTFMDWDAPGGRRDGETARAAALRAAQEWAGKRYGITDWKVGPYGEYASAAVTKAAIERALAREVPA